MFSNISKEIHDKLASILLESACLTKTQAMGFLKSLNGGEYGDVPYVIVNTDSGKNPIQNTKNVVDVEKLKDKDFDNIIGFIKSDGKLAVYKSTKLDSMDIFETEFDIKNLSYSGGKFEKNDDGVYEYVFKGKAGLDAEKHIDTDGMLNVIEQNRDMWFNISPELKSIISSSKVKQLETGLPDQYACYALGALNTKTNLKFDDIVDGLRNENFRSWEIADTIVVDTRNNKYMSISNKLAKGTISIGGIPINEIRAAFTKHPDMDEILGIDSKYVEQLRKLISSNKPLLLSNKFKEEATITGMDNLELFLMNLTESIYRYGYVITETTSDGKIRNSYAVKQDYVSGISDIHAGFTLLSERKRESLNSSGNLRGKLEEAPANKFWTLGFKISFRMHGRLYNWDFRDHMGNGSLTISTIKRVG